jgi:dimethylargininase
MALTALTRLPSATLAQCELSFLDRDPINVDRARRQHSTYRSALRAAGATVVVLPALDELPDAVFVEDTAVVVDELAVVATMGAASRRPESDPMAATLARYRPVHRLAEPATLDGGDVLRVDRTLFVGLTPRTNAAAVDQLLALLAPLGYRVVGVPVTACLHLKSACSLAAPRTVLVNPAWASPDLFDGFDVLTVDPDEPAAGNVLAVGDRVLVPASAPRTLARLRAEGLHAEPIDVSELQKAEAGVTCMSVLIT